MIDSTKIDSKNENLLDPTAPSPYYSKTWLRNLIAVVVIAGIAFSAGASYGRKGLVFEPKDFKILNQKDKVEDVDYTLLWDAIRTVSDNYIERPVDQQKILYGAVQGAVSAAGDEYTEFFDPEELQSFKTDLKGTFEGIGAEIGKKNGNIMIVAPLDESPAKRAGILANDVIVQVDGEITSNWSVDEAVKKIRGQKGTKVTLTLFREGRAKTFDVTITREQISVKSVKLEFKTVGAKNIAVLTVSRFGDDTRSLFDGAVNSILSRKVDGLVLDLRNNPGGYLQTSVDVASDWVAEGKLVVNEQRGDDSSIPYNSLGYGRLKNIKTVVLINGGSASAAEILAGALQDYKIVPLIGEKSFGKGSVQELFDLPDNSAVKITVAKWITPGGKNLHKDGLTPDIEVKRTEDDINASKDPQLDKALEEVVK